MNNNIHPAGYSPPPGGSFPRGSPQVNAPLSTRVSAIPPTASLNSASLMKHNDTSRTNHRATPNSARTSSHHPSAAHPLQQWIDSAGGAERRRGSREVPNQQASSSQPWANAKPGYAPAGYTPEPDHNRHRHHYPQNSPVRQRSTMMMANNTATRSNPPLVPPSGVHFTHDPRVPQPSGRPVSNSTRTVPTSRSNMSKRPPSPHAGGAPNMRVPPHRHTPESANGNVMLGSNTGVVPATNNTLPQPHHHHHHHHHHGRSIPVQHVMDYPPIVSSSRYEPQKEDYLYDSNGGNPRRAPTPDPFLIASRNKDRSFWSEGKFLQFLEEIDLKNKAAAVVARERRETAASRESRLPYFGQPPDTPPPINVDQAEQVYKALKKFFAGSDLAAEAIKLWFTYCGPLDFSLSHSDEFDKPQTKSIGGLKGRLGGFPVHKSPAGLPYCDKVYLFPDAKSMLKIFLKIWHRRAVKGEVPFPPEVDQDRVVYTHWKELASVQGGKLSLQQYLEIFTGRINVAPARPLPLEKVVLSKTTVENFSKNSPFKALPSDVLGVIAHFLDIPSLFTLRQVPNSALHRSLAHGCEEMYIPLLVALPSGRIGEQYCLVYKYFPMSQAERGASLVGGGSALVFAGYTGIWERPDEVPSEMYGMYQAKRQTQPARPEDKKKRTASGRKGFLADLYRILKYSPNYPVHDRAAIVRWCEDEKSTFDVRTALNNTDDDDEACLENPLPYHSVLFTSRYKHYSGLSAFITEHSGLKCLQVASFGEDLNDLWDNIPALHEQPSSTWTDSENTHVGGALLIKGHRIANPAEYLEKLGGSECNQLRFSRSPMVQNIATLVRGPFRVEEYNFTTRNTESRFVGAGGKDILPESIEKVELLGRLVLAHHLKLILQAGHLQRSVGSRASSAHLIRTFETAEGLCRDGTTGYPKSVEFRDLGTRIPRPSLFEPDAELQHRCPAFCSYMVSRRGSSDEDEDYYPTCISARPRSSTKHTTPHSLVELLQADAEKLSADDWRRLFIQENPIVIRRQKSSPGPSGHYGVTTDVDERCWRHFLIKSLGAPIKQKPSTLATHPSSFALGLNPLSGAPMSAEPDLVFRKLLDTRPLGQLERLEEEEDVEDEDEGDDHPRDDESRRHSLAYRRAPRGTYRPTLEDHGLYAVDQEILAGTDETDPLWCPISSLLHPTKSTLYTEVIKGRSSSKTITTATSPPPLESPFVLFGEQYTYSGEHREPEDSYTWAYLLHGHKQWFVQVDAAENTWESFEQHPGDLVFLGPTTLHFVVNQETSILISRNFHVRWDGKF